MSGHVAIVDDDASTRRALARLLRMRGIDGESYPSALAFLEAFPSRMPDCLIVDVNMPEMTAIELQRELLNRDDRIPNIVITGSGDNGLTANQVFVISDGGQPERAHVRIRNSIGPEHYCPPSQLASARVVRAFTCVFSASLS
jgi:CheY-like chemotaxis protein